MYIPPSIYSQGILHRAQSPRISAGTAQAVPFSNYLETASSENRAATADTVDCTAEFLSEFFGKDTVQHVSEEELYAAVTYSRLTEEYGTEAGDSFKKAFRSNLEAGRRADGYAFIETSVVSALQHLVDGGTLATEEAETVNGEAFAAAQLDDNSQELWDHLGSTQAVARVTASLASSAELMTRIAEGRLSIAKRSLSAEHDPRSSSPFHGNTTAPATQVSGMIQTTMRDLQGTGIIWKPVSEGDHKLAVILPSSDSPRITLYTPQGGYIETADDTGLHSESDRRRVYRFDRPGAHYPPGTLLQIGSTTYRIDDTASRYN